METKNILAIETSCDDTSIAILYENKIIENIIFSSSKIQNKYGGVVPEVAAREHEKNIIKAISLINQKIDLNKIDYIAYTNQPGLRVSLNVGEALATTLSKLLNKPLIPVNHIYAHIFSFYEPSINLKYPFISLVASGGHTSIFLVNSPTDIKVLNETKDDAIGEVYDKVARSLSLGYPGGPVIDSLFDKDRANIHFLENMPKPNDQFSFSGLKTQVLNYINQQKMNKKPLYAIDIVSSFQSQAINIIISKLIYYINEYNIQDISIGGGVSANNYLQEKVKQLPIKNVYIPKSKILCGDNAAMIAIYASLLI